MSPCFSPKINSVTNMFNPEASARLRPFVRLLRRLLRVSACSGSLVRVYGLRPLRMPFNLAQGDCALVVLPTECSCLHSYNYSVWATSSFKNHSAGLSALNIATSIIGSVSKPFMAKFADIWGRTATYLLGTIFYVMGYVRCPLSLSLTLVTDLPPFHRSSSPSHLLSRLTLSATSSRSSVGRRSHS